MALRIDCNLEGFHLAPGLVCDVDIKAERGIRISETHLKRPSPAGNGSNRKLKRGGAISWACALGAFVLNCAIGAMLAGIAVFQRFQLTFSEPEFVCPTTRNALAAWPGVRP
ncbi:hypothetical protein BSFA1_66510 (plasmid) [Burkholderia sp. SFA1]|nr:hypothetical protein BSFA1_66510 [Burkholderia sp. SFA1]